MGRLARHLFVAGASAAAVLTPAMALAAPAGAAPHALAAGNCSSTAYSTITPSAQIQSSTQTPFIGESIEASGVNYCPNEDVTITLRGKDVGTAHTDNNGSWDPAAITVTGPTGTAELCGIGASGLSNDRSCLTLTITANGTDGQNNGSDGGGTAYTGVEIAGLIVLAVGLIGGGAALVTAGRKRKSTVA
jgi:hypothetical protein